MNVDGDIVDEGCNGEGLSDGVLVGRATAKLTLSTSYSEDRSSPQYYGHF